MKRQNEFDELIEKFEKAKKLRQAALSMTRIHPQKATKRFFMPIDARLIRVGFLGWGRNAWHSTWINQYHPGTIDCDIDHLKKRAESERVQGSQLWIEIRDALWLKFPRTNALIVQINETPRDEYKQLLHSAEEKSLKKFWQAAAYINQDRLLFFELGKWQPDLVSEKEAEVLHAFNRGCGKTLGWEQKPFELCQNFLRFSEQLTKKCLGSSAVKNL